VDFAPQTQTAESHRPRRTGPPILLGAGPARRVLLV